MGGGSRSIEAVNIILCMRVVRVEVHGRPAGTKGSNNFGSSYTVLRRNSWSIYTYTRIFVLYVCDCVCA